MSVSVNGPALNTSDFPVGGIIMWATSSAPTGWLLCQGQTIQKSAYPELVKVLTGSTTATSATVPDFRGYTPVGAGATQSISKVGRSLLSASGNTSSNLSTNISVPLIKHAHSMQFYKGGVGCPTIYPAGANIGNDTSDNINNVPAQYGKTNDQYFIDDYKGNPNIIGGPLFGSYNETQIDHYNLLSTGSRWFNPWNTQSQAFYNWYKGALNNKVAETYKATTESGTGTSSTVNVSFSNVSSVQPSIGINFIIKAKSV